MANKQKILIVDDDENIANLISLYLTKECYETRIEHDGQSALDAFKEYAPNLILLDIMLPGLDGYEVCREIRRESKVPIIMLSAKTEVFDKVLGLELGADDYIINLLTQRNLLPVLRQFSDVTLKLRLLWQRSLMKNVLNTRILLLIFQTTKLFTRANLLK